MSSAETGVSTLGQGIVIRGKIAGDGDMEIEGTIEGELSIGGDLRIGQSAQVRARVEAGAVMIEGLYEGELLASGPVRAAAGATVQGTISTPGFSMEEGANVSVTIASDFELPAELGG